MRKMSGQYRTYLHLPQIACRKLNISYKMTASIRLVEGGVKTDKCCENVRIKCIKN